jgi:5-methylcytosine-specific restriction endonuclease McrA
MLRNRNGSFTQIPERLQILCFNCNMAKAHNGYCPHETYYHLRHRRRSGGPTN